MSEVEQQRCAALKNSIERSAGTMMGRIENIYDELSGNSGTPDRQLIDMMTATTVLLLAQIQGQLRDFTNAGCQRFFPGFLEEIQRYLADAWRDLRNIADALESRRAPDLGWLVTALAAVLTAIGALLSFLFTLTGGQFQGAFLPPAPADSRLSQIANQMANQARYGDYTSGGDATALRQELEQLAARYPQPATRIIAGGRSRRSSVA